jgi:phosphatidylglycerophosphatase A
MTVIALALATALGAGYAPVAPGTFGSAAGLLLWWLLPASPFSQLVAIAVVFGLGVWSGSIAERHYKSADPSYVVLDEVLGMLITMFMIPSSWVALLSGFVIFRVTDVVKPYPANRLEALHGGFGIMADDAMAGVYANVALRVVLMFLAWVGFA